MKYKWTKVLVLWGVVLVFGLSGPLVFGSESPPALNVQKVALGTTPITNELLIRLAEMTRPSVVNVSTTMQPEIGDQGLPFPFPFPFFEPSPFRQPFGDAPERRGVPPEDFGRQGTGSGVIISSDGYIVTNNHVVAEATDIQVLLADERKFSARLIGVDLKTDLAVIKIDAKNLPFLKWGDSNRLKVGEMVLAVGSPFGLNQTVTMGIVSAVGRANVGIVDYEDFIQTDAAINPGNSGGALVNVKGELVGINTAIFSQSGGYIGIGFAIPSRMAEIVSQALIKEGKVVRGWLGVSIQDLTPDLAKQFHVSDTNGVLLSNVSPNGAADKAKLRRGDVIRQYEGRMVRNAVHLRTLVAETKPGKSVTLSILRDGQQHTVHVVIGDQPREFPLAKKPGEGEGRHALAGVVVDSVQPGEAPEDQGVVVRDVQPGSPASRAGLQRQDIILEINRQVIQDARDFNRLVQKLGPSDSVLLVVRRGNGVFYLPIKP